MATSGTYYSSHVACSTSYRIYLSYEVTAQSIEDNTSTVHVVLGMQKTAASTGAYDSGAKWWLKVAGKWVTSSGGSMKSWDMRSSSSGTKKSYYSKTVTITHDENGDASIALYGAFQGPNTGYTAKSTISKTVTLPHIPRMTTPTFSKDPVVMGEAVTIDLTGAASETFTHALRYTTPGGSGVIAAGIGAVRQTWTVPDFAEKIPAAVTGAVVIECVTYDGSGTLIGSKTATLTVSVPTSVVPVINAVTVEETAAGLAEKYKAFIQTKSRPKVTITAAGAKGSAISSITSTLEGATYTGGSWTAGAALAGAGNLAIQVTVTDTRGRTASRTETISVLAYAPPVISRFAASRCDDKGAAADDGNYAKLSYAYAAPSLNGGNTVAMTVKAKKPAETAYTVELLSGSALTADTAEVSRQAVSSDNRWDIQLSVRDSFGAVTTATVQLPTADVITDYKADGAGMAIGKTSEQAGLDIAWPVLMRKNLQVDGGINGDLTGSVKGKLMTSGGGAYAGSNLTLCGDANNEWLDIGGISGSNIFDRAHIVFSKTDGHPWIHMYKNGANAAAPYGTQNIYTSAFPPPLMWRLLWTNGSMDANFGEQTLTFNSLDYDLFLFVCMYDSTATDKRYFGCLGALPSGVNTGVIALMVPYAGATVRYAARSVTINKTAKTLAFGAGSLPMVDSGSSSSKRAVPAWIYAGKTV